jgi:hypothetical protein
LGPTSALAAGAPAKPIEVTSFGEKPAVTFDHSKHAIPGVECTRCHHTAGQDKYKCGECHGAQAKDKAPSIRDAMHKREIGVCYSCHFEKDSKNKLKCGDCHKK